MKMMMNLFEIFDPTTSMFFSLNWISPMLIFIILPLKFWIIPSRFEILIILISKIIFSEFKNLTKKKYKMNILIFFSLMIFIALSNFMGLFPYIFTSTSHISFNLIIALSSWLGFFIYSWLNKPLMMLIHLVPMNTPPALMNFMVMIELISNIIRPFTLAIRLTANMIAGHLLLTLLGTFISKFLILLPFTIILQNMLMILEIAVSMIQAYVFSILSLLYFLESKN
uniref:ATP synthase subunit a n=1 Tax=Osmia rufa TaxID=1437190 RepID=A0A0S2LTM8_OSMRU|nr:ATP synthase F0 subunit 6 [Osmia bicornis]